MSGSGERDLRDDVTARRMLLTETTAERDQLRTAVEAVRPVLALFVRFVRLNPGLAEDDPLVERVFNAYRVLAQLDETGEATR